MSKADTLLKKATFFERLALYSDRKSFLQALAGGATGDWTPEQHSEQDIKASIKAVVDAANNWRNQYGNRLVDAAGSPRLWSAPVTNMMTELNNMVSGSVDYEKAYRIMQQLANQMPANLAKLGIQDNQEEWTRAVSGLAGNSMTMIGKAVSWSKQNIPAPPPEAPEEQGSGTVTIPEVTVPGRAAPPAINRADQQAVFNFATGGVGKVDGVRGPETDAALKKIKQHFQQLYKYWMSDAQAIQAAKYNKDKPLP